MTASEWLLALNAILITLGAAAAGIYKTREARIERQETRTDAKDQSALAIVTAELTFWRNRSIQLEVELNDAKRELWSRTGDLEHTADVAQAAIAALHLGRKQASNEHS